MRHPKMEKAFRIVIAVCLLAYLTGCGNDSPTASNNTPPQIPSPEATMMIDMSFFNQNQGSSEDILTGSKQNFLTAVAVVTVFNVAVLVGISVPAAATLAALSVEPTLEADGKFHWRFTFSENGIDLALELTAEVNQNTVAWEMFVTGNFPIPLENFLWFDGQSQIDGSSGHWQFYNPEKPSEKDETVRIDWQVVSEDERTLIFTNNNDESEDFGDTLTYMVKGDDVTMTFVKAATQETIQVSYNKQSEEGFIIAPNYNNGEKACWDGNQDDVACQ